MSLCHMSLCCVWLSAGIHVVIEYGEIRTSDNFEVRMMGAVEVSKSIWLTFGSDADEVESRTPARSDKVMMS